MRLRNYFALALIAGTTLFVGCAGEDVNDPTRGGTPSDGVMRNTPNALDTPEHVTPAPVVETVPDSVLEKNADCPFLGKWKLISIEGKELFPAQKDMTLAFLQDGSCEMEGAGQVRKGKWVSEDWKNVSIVDPNGPNEEMEIVSIEAGAMVFISNGLDKITVHKVIETPVE